MDFFLGLARYYYTNPSSTMKDLFTSFFVDKKGQSTKTEEEVKNWNDSQSNMLERKKLTKERADLEAQRVEIEKLKLEVKKLNSDARKDREASRKLRSRLQTELAAVRQTENKLEELKKEENKLEENKIERLAENYVHDYKQSLQRYDK